METLYELSRKVLDETDTAFVRYLHDTINWKNRMIGLTGPRGVGKTTLILQHIKMNLPPAETLYVTAEDFYFLDNRLTSLAADFAKHGGKYLFIDEIHKYEGWSKELKLIYDYHPELQVVFTGSSVLDIKRGEADLSRRARMYHLQGLSFREYLHLFHNISVPVATLGDVLEHRVELPRGVLPLPLFADYLKQGYYPFARNEDFEYKLQQVINQTMEVDIPYYANMNVSTGRKLKQLLSIISKSVPFKPNMTTIAATLASSRNNIADYLVYIEEAGMIAQLRDATGGIRGLGKVDKVYLDNTNLIYALAAAAPDKGNIRETFFLNQLRLAHEVISSPVSDFRIDDMTFEVGGRNKGKKQIADIPAGYIVKDDIEIGFRNTIPLWQFGLMY
jgi:predicted AAA+ superfamily ATPase